MAELRKDPVLGRWVVIGTERVCRPADFHRPSRSRPQGPCALCRGHEHETPPEILSYRTGDGAAAAPWHVRVVPNRFPALRPEGEIERHGHGLYDVVTGVGVDELVVATPRHDERLVDVTLAALEDVLRACRERVIELRRDTRLRSVLVHHTHTAEGLPHQSHAHLQIVGLPIVPFSVAEEQHQSRAYYDYRERCLLCDMLQQEATEGSRVVAMEEQFIAFAPFAPRHPFETWIAPRRHAASFDRADGPELNGLARILQNVLHKLDRVLSDPPLDFIVHSAPLQDAESPSYHWHVEITPNLLTGLRTGDVSRLPINPVPPEDCARYLRATTV